MTVCTYTRKGKRIEKSIGWRNRQVGIEGKEGKVYGGSSADENRSEGTEMCGIRQKTGREGCPMFWKDR